jgi:hypothetical protein
MSLPASFVREPILADSFTQQKPFPFLVATQTLPLTAFLSMPPIGVLRDN